MKSTCLENLLKEISIISNAVKEDFIAEVGWSPAGSLGVGAKVWDVYIKERSKSLRLAGGIDKFWVPR